MYYSISICKMYVFKFFTNRKLLFIFRKIMKEKICSVEDCKSHNSLCVWVL